MEEGYNCRSNFLEQMREGGASVPGEAIMAITVHHCDGRKTAHRIKTVAGLENEVRKYIEAPSQELSLLQLK